MRCFELATDPFLGFVRAADGPTFRASGEIDISGLRGTVYRSASRTTEAVTIVIDRANGVPLRVEFRSGDAWEWEYASREEGIGAPPAQSGSIPSVPTEVYRDLTRTEGATALKLSTLPDVLLGLPLTAVFSYRPADRPGSVDATPGSVYAIWRAPLDPDAAADETATVQMVITDQPPPSSGVRVEDLGGTLIMTFAEEAKQVAISAPDRPSLVAAVRVLRPAFRVPAASSE